MNYVSNIVRLHYKQHDRKKFSLDVFRKEIAGAYEYGKLESTIELVKRSEGLTRDELIGEMHILIKDTYHKCRKEFGLLKIPMLELEDILEVKNGE